MAGDKLISLKYMIEQIGENRVKQELSIFSCPLNKDVESFIRYKAIELGNVRVYYEFFQSHERDLGGNDVKFAAKGFQYDETGLDNRLLIFFNAPEGRLNNQAAITQ